MCEEICVIFPCGVKIQLQSLRTKIMKLFPSPQSYCNLLWGSYKTLIKWLSGCHFQPLRHLCSCCPTPNVFPQKLVSHGGLDFCAHCLAPFEISVLGDRRTASAARASTGQPSLPPFSTPLLSPLQDNWFLLVLRARCSLLAPFEIGYKTVDRYIWEFLAKCRKEEQRNYWLFCFLTRAGKTPMDVVNFYVHE